MLWLKTYRPQLYEVAPEVQARMDEGNAVGDLAMGLFGEFTEVTALKADGRLDVSRMIENTKNALIAGVSVICEASFSYHGLYCAVDILRKTENGYEFYEVKNSSVVKPIHLQDASYQRYVLEKCGVKLVGAYIVTVNPDYQRPETGKPDLQAMFRFQEIGKELTEKSEIELDLKIAERMIKSHVEPKMSVGEHCHSPYECGFQKYCFGKE